MWKLTFYNEIISLLKISFFHFVSETILNYLTIKLLNNDK